MQTFDKITILGAAGRDCEMRYLPDGTPVSTLSLAASNSWKSKDSDEWKTVTRWYKVSAFGRQAEYVNENVSKGDLVFVEGRLNSDENGAPRIWTGQDGKPHASFEVRADLVRITTKSKKNGEAHSEETTNEEDM